MKIEFSNSDADIWHPISYYLPGDIVAAAGNKSTIVLILRSGRLYDFARNEDAVMGDDYYRTAQWRKVDARLVVTL